MDVFISYRRDGGYALARLSFNFTRIYDASDKDITLKFMFEQSAYNTRLESFKGTITITALD